MHDAESIGTAGDAPINTWAEDALDEAVPAEANRIPAAGIKRADSSGSRNYTRNIGSAKGLRQLIWIPKPPVFISRTVTALLKSAQSK